MADTDPSLTTRAVVMPSCHRPRQEEEFGATHTDTHTHITKDFYSMYPPVSRHNNKKNTSIILSGLTLFTEIMYISLSIVA